MLSYIYINSYIYYKKGLDICKIIIGADEAGRGCIAGSIYGAAVAFIPNGITRENFKEKHPKIMDSKKIKKREERSQLAHEIMCSFNIIYHIESCNVQYINKYGIGQANRCVLIKSIDNLIYKLKVMDYNNIEVIVDGNLKLESQYFPSINIESIVKADSKIFEVSAASILAKHAKDIETFRLKELYPAFSFDKHSGYDTKKHREELIRNGYIPDVHRIRYKTFKKLNINYVFTNLI